MTVLKFRRPVYKVAHVNHLDRSVVTITLFAEPGGRVMLQERCTGYPDREFEEPLDAEQLAMFWRMENEAKGEVLLPWRM